MTSKAQRQQVFVDASLRLEGLPISTSDDDLYAAAIEGPISGELRDVVAARMRADEGGRR